MYPFNSEIKITENMLFAVDYKNTLRAFNVSDGSELWNFQTERLFYNFRHHKLSYSC